MIEFLNGLDLRVWSPNKPTVARLIETPCARNGRTRTVTHYVVIGTQYGYIHTTAGDVHTWRSASGAYRAAARYVPL